MSDVHCRPARPLSHREPSWSTNYAHSALSCDLDRPHHSLAFHRSPRTEKLLCQPSHAHATHCRSPQPCISRTTSRPYKFSTAQESGQRSPDPWYTCCQVVRPALIPPLHLRSRIQPCFSSLGDQLARWTSESDTCHCSSKRLTKASHPEDVFNSNVHHSIN
jgi:hypothetical protein